MNNILHYGLKVESCHFAKLSVFVSALFCFVANRKPCFLSASVSSRRVFGFEAELESEKKAPVVVFS